MQKPNISVIIPFYGKWELTHQRLMDLWKWVQTPLEIILVNDCSQDSTIKGGIAWWQKSPIHHTIKYVENPKNIGFGGSHNRGAKAATGDILIFLSNDVMIRKDFVSPIVAVVKENSNVIIGGRIVYWDSGWNTIQMLGKKVIVPYPEGWLVACTREMWERIGGWDRRYGRFDYEDVDLGAWAAYNDVDLVGLNMPELHHISGATIGEVAPNREEYTKKNQQVFIEKWKLPLEKKFGAQSDNDESRE